MAETLREALSVSRLITFRLREKTALSILAKKASFSRLLKGMFGLVELLMEKMISEFEMDGYLPLAGY